jgi:hypothetical protein
MADISDVLVVVAGQIAATVYPNGTGAPSVANCDIRVYPGWPFAAALDADLLAGKVNISVYPTQIESNVTKYQRRWQVNKHNVATLAMVLSGLQVTISGSIPNPFYAQNLAILIGDDAYLYPVQMGDTLSAIATSLANQIPGATSVGAVITLPAGPTPILRVGAGGTAVQEIRRQKRVVQITVWAPTPTLRDVVAQSIDVVLADLAFLTMPDGTGGRMIYQNSPMDDSMQKAKVYRRDLRYSVEFGTTKQMATTEVVVGVVSQETKTSGINISIKPY